MQKRTAFVAALFLVGTAEQIQYRLDRHLPAHRRPGGVRVEASARFDAVELRLYSIDYEMLRRFAAELEKPGKFAGSFIGPWRVGYRELEAAPGDVRVINAGTLAECLDDVSLRSALGRAEGATPTLLTVIRQHVDEADVLQMFRRAGEVIGNEPHLAGDWIDLHFGDDRSHCGASYFRPRRELFVGSDSLAVLRRCLGSHGIAPFFGVANWLAARVPVIQARGERPVEEHLAFSAGASLSLDRFLELFEEHERSRAGS
jgi:hypothetical protein